MSDIQAMTRPTPDGGLMLDDLSRQAADLVRPGLACAVTLREFRTLRVAGASDLRARRAGAVQQAEHAGPGLGALEEHRVVVMAEIGRTRRWPAWRDIAVREGFRTAVALPAPVSPGVDLAVELLGETPDPWQRDELRRAAAFAAQVARVAGLELEAARTRSVTEELYGALAARDTIGQATGIVMAQRTCGPEEALAVLRRAAEHRNLALRDVATMIVGDVARADQIGAAMFTEAPQSFVKQPSLVTATPAVPEPPSRKPVAPHLPS
jgi:hypothetical protein